MVLLNEIDKLLLHRDSELLIDQFQNVCVSASGMFRTIERKTKPREHMLKLVMAAIYRLAAIKQLNRTCRFKGDDTALRPP